MDEAMVPAGCGGVLMVFPSPCKVHFIKIQSRRVAKSVAGDISLIYFHSLSFYCLLILLFLSGSQVYCKTYMKFFN